MGQKALSLGDVGIPFFMSILLVPWITECYKKVMTNKTFFFASLVLLSYSTWLGCGEAEAPADEAMAVEPEIVMPKPGESVLIPAGEFTMGTDQQAPPEVAVPEHTIDLPAYSIDVYEVTLGEWIKFITETDFQPEGNWRQFYSIGKEDHPVSNVTWEDAKAYCEWAGKRLPTEAEWEKAARGPENTRYSWGDLWDATKSNSSEMGMRNTMEVGENESDKSAYGVYDMVGNSQEWTSEKLVPYPDSPAPRDDAFRSNYIAVRGGSYAVKGRTMGLFSRSGYESDSQYGIGFRCAKDVE